MKKFKISAIVLFVALCVAILLSSCSMEEYHPCRASYGKSNNLTKRGFKAQAKYKYSSTKLKMKSVW